MFEYVQRALFFIQRTKRVDRKPSIAKMRLLRKKDRKPLLSFMPRTKSTQTSGSVFEERNEQVEKIKNELEWIKSRDCFLDG